MTPTVRRTLLAATLAAAVVAALMHPVSAETTDTGCVSADAGLLAKVAAKAERHKTTGRSDLAETFGRAHQTMLGQDSYTVSDLKARPDRQTPNWQGNGPNALWQSVYAELDRLQGCRAAAQAQDPTPEESPPPADDSPPQVPQDGPPQPAADNVETPQDSSSESTPPPAPSDDTLETTTQDDQDTCTDPCISLSRWGWSGNGYAHFRVRHSGNAPPLVYLNVQGVRPPRKPSSARGIGARYGEGYNTRVYFWGVNPRTVTVLPTGSTVTVTVVPHRMYSVHPTEGTLTFTVTP
ncbi:MAG: hypothetical protein OXF75_02810 [Acidimicrobiaceae bacterium]|nr:hypothetical protein [Acidimicrobiaceae bacterium]